jgi:hypothetical protein
MYDISERGGNSDATWVRLRGRVYAAFRDGRYGADQVVLLRPWRGPGQVPRLDIRYRYRLSVPAVQQVGGKPEARLAPALHQALNAAVAAPLPAADHGTKRATPICPVPADAPDDVREASVAYGPAHYTIEAIADVRVQVGAQCHIGQIRTWYGRYAPPEGLAAELCIRKPEELEPADDNCYAVQGARTVARLDAGSMPYN